MSALAPDTQLSRLRRHMAAGDWGKALKLAASWRRLGPQRNAIQRGWEAFARPDFYREIKRDPEQLIDEGIAALKERYGA